MSLLCVKYFLRKARIGLILNETTWKIADDLMFSSNDIEVNIPVSLYKNKAMETPIVDQNTNTANETAGDSNDNTNNKGGYIPGVCNIGPLEIKKRRDGIFAVVAFLVIVIVLLELLHANKLWRFIIILPALSLGIGFQQWYFKFCVGFGFKGLFNFGDLGKTYTVEQKEDAKLDRLRAATIIMTSVFFAVIASLVYYYI